MFVPPRRVALYSNSFEDVLDKICWGCPLLDKIDCHASTFVSDTISESVYLGSPKKDSEECVCTEEAESTSSGTLDIDTADRLPKRPVAIFEDVLR